MKLDSYLQFLRDIGHDVIDMDGMSWFNPSAFLYSPVLIQAEVRPDTYDLRKLFRHRCLAIRCATPDPWGRKSYRLVVADPQYGLESLDSKSRNQTRRGLEACQVRPVDFLELAREGLPLHVETMQRQGRKVRSGALDYWKRYFTRAAGVNCAVAWAAYCNREMAAYVVGFTLERVTHILLVRSATRHLRRYPNNALIFAFTQHMLATGAADEVSIGFESLQPQLDSLDHFKEGLGFRRKTVNQYVELTPAISRIMRGPIVPAASAALRLLLSPELGGKLTGLLSWCEAQRLAQRTATEPSARRQAGGSP